MIILPTRIFSSVTAHFSNYSHQCSLSYKVKFRWLRSLFSILMTSLNWLLTQWNSCSSMFMFHEVTTFSTLTEALMSRSETLLLTMLLNRWVVQDSTDLMSHVIMKEDKSCWNKNKCFLMSENSKNLLWISGNNWVLYSKNFLQIEWWKRV